MEVRQEIGVAVGAVPESGGGEEGGGAEVDLPEGLGLVGGDGVGGGLGGEFPFCQVSFSGDSAGPGGGGMHLDGIADGGRTGGVKGKEPVRAEGEDTLVGIESEAVVADGDFGVADGDVALVGVDAVGGGLEADEAEGGDIAEPLRPRA